METVSEGAGGGIRFTGSLFLSRFLQLVRTRDLCQCVESSRLAMTLLEHDCAIEEISSKFNCQRLNTDIKK